MRRIDAATVRAAAWTLVEHWRVRRQLRRGGVLAAGVRPPRRASRAGTRGVNGVLRRRAATCLERALVLQRWYAAQGVRRDVIIGVRPPVEDFAAHAWLEGEPEETGEPFRELHRLAP